MSDVAVKVHGLSKRYRIGARENYPTIRESLMRAAWAPLRAVQSWASAQNNGIAPASIWALRDVELKIPQGEVMGIIGPNGAGKSTLLKILSGITEPTSGYADIYGRIGSLLEVGTGFHMELTGRENVFMNGALLGMTRHEIRAKFDEIVAFAEIAKFIDTPVKHYSTGMYMRLAFAVAAHLEPEILIVDEVLAVGDAAFQEKCLGKMNAVAKDGRTVLFVSHNLLAIGNLCNRVVWLEDGRIAGQGHPTQVIPSYLQKSLAPATERVWPQPKNQSVTQSVRLHRVRVRLSCDTVSGLITVHTPFCLEFEYWNSGPDSYISTSFSLLNEQGVLLFDIATPFDPNWRQKPSPVGLLSSTCRIPGDFLNDGLYRVSLIVLRNHIPVIEEADALVFRVEDGSMEERDGWYGKWPGVIRPRFEWKTDVVITPNVRFLNP